MKAKIGLLNLIILWHNVLPAEEIDHSKMNHASPSEIIDHSQMLMPTETTDTPRNPNAFADGYTLDKLPFLHAHNSDNTTALIVDRLESITTSADTSMTYDLQAWLGKTYDHLLLRAEGDMRNGNSQDARTELVWSHAISPFWDSHLGLRYDSGENLNRGWLAFGVQGLAPYWLYVEATAYINEQGRTAFRLELEYDLLITQRLILQPRLEANVYAQNDAAHYLGSGLANFETGLRLRYEFKPEFAPYIGIDWGRHFGDTAGYARQQGIAIEETRFVAGVHFWF
ncbi:MAG: copper resistance protein B [Methylococcaceae bacterium]